MSKHTPGPWTFDDRNKIWSQNPKKPWTIIHVADVKHLDYEQGYNIHKANARLIAAAPELLEALEELTKLTETLLFVSNNPEPGSIGHKCRAAIAKAKGEQ